MIARAVRLWRWSWPAHRRTAAVGLLTAGIVLATLASALVVQQPRWEASLSLEVRAQPERTVDQVTDRLALSSPAIVEAVRTPRILRAAIGASGVRATPRDVADSVRVDILNKPGSVSLAVTRDAAPEARRLLVALADQVVDLDLLSPQARLVVISPVIEVVQVEPRPSVGLVLALGSAMGAGLGASLAHLLAGRRVRSITDLRRVATALGVAAVDARPASDGRDQLAGLARWLLAPTHVRIRTVGAVAADDVDDVSTRLSACPEGRCPSSTTVVLVARGTSTDLVRATVTTARHSAEDVSAVLLR